MYVCMYVCLYNNNKRKQYIRKVMLFRFTTFHVLRVLVSKNQLMAPLYRDSL